MSQQEEEFTRTARLRHLHLSTWQDFIIFSDTSSAAGRSIAGGTTFAHMCSLTGHAGSLRNVFITRDGRFAVASTSWVTANNDQVFVWRLAVCESLGRLRPSAVLDVAARSSPDATQAHGIKAETVTASPCGRFIAAVTSKGDSENTPPHVAIFDLERPAKASDWHPVISCVALVKLQGVESVALKVLEWSRCGTKLFFNSHANLCYVDFDLDLLQQSITSSDDRTALVPHVSAEVHELPVSPSPASTARITGLHLLPNGKQCVIVRAGGVHSLHCFASQQEWRLSGVTSSAAPSDNRRITSSSDSSTICIPGGDLQGSCMFSSLFGLQRQRIVSTHAYAAGTPTLLPSSADEQFFPDRLPGETAEQRFHRALTCSPALLAVVSEPKGSIHLGSSCGITVYDVTANSTNYCNRLRGRSAGQGVDARLVSELELASDTVYCATDDGGALLCGSNSAPLSLLVRTHGAPCGTIAMRGLSAGRGPIVGLRVAGDEESPSVHVKFANGDVEEGIMLPESAKQKL